MKLVSKSDSNEDTPVPKISIPDPRVESGNGVDQHRITVDISEKIR